MVGTPSARDSRTPIREMGTPRRGSATPIRSFTPKVSTPRRRGARSVTGSRDEAPIPEPAPSPSPAAPPFAGHLTSPPLEVVAESPNPDFQQQVSLLAQLPLQDAIRCVTTAKDGKKVWTGDRSGAIRIRDTYTGEVLTPSQESQVQGQQCPLVEKPGVLPNAMTYTPSGGGQVWVGFSDGFVRVFSYLTDTLLTEMIHHNGPVLAVLADGATVYSAGHDWKIIQWSAETLKSVTTYTGHRNAVRCLAMGPTCLVSGGDDGTVRLWNASRMCFKGGHLGSVLSIASVHDAIWSAGDDGVICIWDHSTGALRNKLSGHKAPVTSLLCVEGGRVVWSTDKHGVVIIWETTGPQMLQRLSPDSSDWQRNGITASCVVHRAVNWRVWTCSGDGSVRIWNTPSISEGEECALLAVELERLQASRDSQSVQLESLMAAQDSVALKQEVDVLRTALDDQQRLLIESDHRIVDMAAETDTLRFEVEKYRGFEVDFQQERQRRMDVEALLSRNEAKLVVAQQEVAARTSALTAAEEERQKHVAAVERLTEVERELDCERLRRQRTEETVGYFEGQNAELRKNLTDTSERLKHASSSARQQSSTLASQRDIAMADVDTLSRVALNVVEMAELDARSVIADLEHHVAVMLETQLHDIRARMASSVYVETVASVPPMSPPPVPVPQMVRDNEEVLTLRIQSLESALAESHKRCVSQSCDEQASLARTQQLESMLAAHQAELAETAAMLAKTKCDFDARSIEVHTKETEIARLQEATAVKEGELVEATTQLQRFKQQLEQNIMCISNMEEKLKFSQEEMITLGEEKTILTQVNVDLSTKVKELEHQIVLRDASLRGVENSVMQQKTENDLARTNLEQMRTDLDGYRIKDAKQEEALLRNEEEKCELVLQVNNTSAMLDKLRTELQRSEEERDAAQKLGEHEATKFRSENERLQARLLELTGTVAERDAQLDFLKADLEAKSEHIEKQTEVLSEAVGEVTERRRATAELAEKLYDMELHSKLADGTIMKHREASMQAEALMQNSTVKWNAEKAVLEDTVVGLREELRMIKDPYDALRIKLDTTLRELALTREDSQCEIRMLQGQLQAKNSEISKLKNSHLSPPGTPRPYILHTDDDITQHTPAYHTESYPSIHSRSISPKAVRQ